MTALALPGAVQVEIEGGTHHLWQTEQLKIDVSHVVALLSHVLEAIIALGAAAAKAKKEAKTGGEGKEGKEGKSGAK